MTTRRRGVVKVFQKWVIAGGAALAVIALTVTVVFGGHGGGYHPEPGHGSGRNHHLGNNFHHYCPVKSKTGTKSMV